MKPLAEIELTTMVYGGEAMGRLSSGKPVFVPLGIDGEQVRVEIVEEKSNYCRGRLLDVLQASPRRITPRCKHYGVCGGCHYQHLGIDDQLALKKKIVIDQFRRIGKFEIPPVMDTIGSPEPWNYRNTVQFHLATSGRVGYEKAGSNTLVEISECHLPQPLINQAWPRLEIDPTSGVERVSLREGADGELLLLLQGGPGSVPEFEVDFPISAVYAGEGTETVLSGDGFTVMNVKGRDYRVSAESFFQVNLPQAEHLVDLVTAALELQAQDTVLDGYCGVGLFSAMMAPHVSKVIGVELAESACDDFVVNLDEFDNVELYVGAAEQVLPRLKTKANKVVVDPPRAGLERAALDAILAMAPEKIVYVSCDPSTLARDARLMTAAGYSLDRITPVDLFPQTYHIECVAVMSRAEQ
jgi:23S rRNA (uracil1939-C5)-methyltransferase